METLNVKMSGGGPRGKKKKEKSVPPPSAAFFCYAMPLRWPAHENGL
jgi:hypothetical protein